MKKVVTLTEKPEDTIMNVGDKTELNTQSTTIFDDVFRTISQEMPHLLIPLINEVFGTEYPEDQKFEQLRNEYYDDAGKTITDSILKIGNFLYHIECQSRKDKTMAVRMFQYDAAIAIERALLEDNNESVIQFPQSCVLYIRNHTSIGTHHNLKVKFPDGQTVKYMCPVIKVKDYTLDEIFDKGLLMFLPYYIMRHEAFLKSCKEDQKKIEGLLAEYERIYKRLEDITVIEERGRMFFELCSMIKKIADHIIPNKSPYIERIGDVMGGKAMKLRSEELLEMGEARGEARGEAKTLVKNIESLVQSLAKPVEEVCALLGTTFEAYVSAKTLIGK